jgi:L-alanine-DL-glutamate epimerase-like enolase superfamily enzyme
MASVRIAAADLFYLTMPETTEAADGTQDSLVVRIREEGGLSGFGECDASPLVTIAAYVCPTSHGNIQNLRSSLVGERLDSPDDIRRIAERALRRGLDIEQIHHALSGAEIALWDLLGRRRGSPVWQLLEEGAGGRPRAHPKLPYGSVLFADTPEATRERAAELRGRGFRAAKFGWGPLGAGEAQDVELVRAAREGLGPGLKLMVDAGVAFGEDDETAYRRAVAFRPFDLHWLEEPLLPDAVSAYRRLAERRPPVPIAAGEGSNRYRFAEDLIENGKVSFIQIDAGRIGGLDAAHRVRRLAESRGVVYVNHTFKSHLSLAAALHVFAAVERFELLEYPAGGSELASSLVEDPLLPGPDGLVRVPEAPGLGVQVSRAALERFLLPVEIRAGGELLYRTPSLD